ncbi:MAG: ATP-binding protein [Methanomassiliicoccales archaeon]
MPSSSIAPAIERFYEKMDRISPVRLTAIIVMLSILIFLLDIYTKIGQAAGIYYVVPIALTILYLDTRAPWIAVLLLSPFIIGGFFLKPPGPMDIALFNRPTILIMAYVTASIVWIGIRSRMAVLERKAFMDAILSTTPNLIRVYDRNEGRDVYRNKDHQRIADGVTGSDASIFDLLRDADLDNGIGGQAVQQELANGDMVENEVGVRGEDGKVRRFIDRKVVFRRDPSGQPVQFVHTYTDVSDLIEANERLDRERDRLRITLESIGDGVIATDINGTVTLLNGVAEKLTGFSKELAVGKHINEIFRIIDEGTGAPRTNPIEKVLKMGCVVELTNHTALICRDGTRYNIADSGAPIKTLEGETVGVILVFRDVTNESLLSSEITRLQRMESIGMLAGGIAHDFNNLLMGIYGKISLAKELMDSSSRASHILDEAERSMNIAKGLSSQLLTFSKGGAPLMDREDPRKIMESSLGLILSGSDVAFQLRSEEGLWDIKADPVQITQVFNNLLRNAIEAMSKDRNIIVELNNFTMRGNERMPLEPGKYVMVRITDHGVGIAPENLPRIFDPYYTTKSKNAGLGLSIVHSIVKKHDGHMSVESQLGKGTTFTIYIPAIDEPRREKHVSAEPMLNLGGHLLIMDDQEPIREVLKEMLESMGFRVDTVEDGESAVKSYRLALEEQDPYTLVILDLTIPGGMGGRETIRHLRELDPEVKAIVSSGYSNDETMAEHRTHGFSGVIPKPFTKDELAQEIKKVLLDTEA